MKAIYHGLLISFLGSLPLGVLNLVALQLYLSAGLSAAMSFIIGVVMVELVVLFLTFRFAMRLAAMPKLVNWLRGFSVCFLLAIALVFAFGGNSEVPELPVYTKQIHPLALGLLLNAINPVQVPFWLGWNNYLAERHVINRELLIIYISSAAIGTSAAMLLFIYTGGVLWQLPGLSALLRYLCAAVLFLMAVWQALRLVRTFVNKRA